MAVQALNGQIKVSLTDASSTLLSLPLYSNEEADIIRLSDATGKKLQTVRISDLVADGEVEKADASNSFTYKFKNLSFARYGVMIRLLDSDKQTLLVKHFDVWPDKEVGAPPSIEADITKGTSSSDNGQVKLKITNVENQGVTKQGDTVLEISGYRIRYDYNGSTICNEFVSQNTAGTVTTSSVINVSDGVPSAASPYANNKLTVVRVTTVFTNTQQSNPQEEESEDHAEERVIPGDYPTATGPSTADDDKADLGVKLSFTNTMNAAASGMKPKFTFALAQRRLAGQTPEATWVNIDTNDQTWATNNASVVLKQTLPDLQNYDFQFKVAYGGSTNPTPLTIDDVAGTKLPAAPQSISVTPGYKGYLQKDGSANGLRLPNTTADYSKLFLRGDTSSIVDFSSNVQLRFPCNRYLCNWYFY
jgi:hypothetical protein